MIIIAGSLLFTGTSAQVMTMDECMAYAVEHSVSVGKQENALDNARMNYKQSVASLFPSVRLAYRQRRTSDVLLIPKQTVILPYPHSATHIAFRRQCLSLPACAM
jgi:hypothetical protein